MGLATTTTLYQFGCLANHLACIETMVAHHIITEHHAEGWLAFLYRTDHTEKVGRYALANLKHKVFGRLGRHGQHSGYHADTIDHASLADEALLGTLYCLGLEMLYILLHGVVLLNIFLYHGMQVLGIVEQ